MIKVNKICKSFRGNEVLKNISFSVDRGEIFGILGPDGAGKTTLFRILTTLLLAKSGTATVNGLDVVKDFQKIREQVGYMPGRFSLYQDLTVEENINFFATLFGTTVAQNYHIVKDIYSQIEPFKDRRAGKLSGGMKQKLALSCALIHKPVVLFLDEPTTGVDPVSRKEFWDILQNLKNMGITIIVSTPYMDEASRCDRISLIKEGRLLYTDTPLNTIKNFKRAIWACKSTDLYRLLSDLRRYAAVKSAFAFGESIHALINDGADMDELKTYLINKGHENIEVEKVVPTVEDCYIWYDYGY